MKDIILRHPSLRFPQFKEQTPTEEEMLSATHKLAATTSAYNHLVGVAADGTLCTFNLSMYEYSVTQSKTLGNFILNNTPDVLVDAELFKDYEKRLGSLLLKMNLSYAEPQVVMAKLSHKFRPIFHDKSLSPAPLSVAIHDHKSPESCDTCSKDNASRYGKLIEPPTGLTCGSLILLFKLSTKRIVDITPPFTRISQAVIDKEVNALLPRVARAISSESPVTPIAYVYACLHTAPPHLLHPLIGKAILDNHPDASNLRYLNRCQAVVTFEASTQTPVYNAIGPFLPEAIPNGTSACTPIQYTNTPTGSYRTYEPEAFSINIGYYRIVDLNKKRSIPKASQGTQTPLPYVGDTKWENNRVTPKFASLNTEIIYVINEAQQVLPVISKSTDSNDHCLVSSIPRHLHFINVQTKTATTPFLLTDIRPLNTHIPLILNIGYLYFPPSDKQLEHLNPLLIVPDSKSPASACSLNLINKLCNLGFTVIAPDRRNEGFTSGLHNTPQQNCPLLPWSITDLGFDFLQLIKSIQYSLISEQAILKVRLKPQNLKRHEVTVEEKTCIQKAIDKLGPKIEAYNHCTILACNQGILEALMGLVQLNGQNNKSQLPIDKLVFLIADQPIAIAPYTATDQPITQKSVQTDITLANEAPIDGLQFYFNAIQANAGGVYPFFLNIIKEAGLLLNVATTLPSADAYHRILQKHSSHRASQASDLLMKETTSPSLFDRYFNTTSKMEYSQILEYANNEVTEHEHHINNLDTNALVSFNAVLRGLPNNIRFVGDICKKQNIPCIVLQAESNVRFPQSASTDLACAMQTHHAYVLKNDGQSYDYSNAIFELLLEVNTMQSGDLVNPKLKLSAKPHFYHHASELSNNDGHNGHAA